MIGSATVARFAAVFNGWGIGYVVLNVAVSYGAYNGYRWRGEERV